MTSILVTLAAVCGVAVVANCVWHAILSARTPQGAVAWAVFLISSPWLAMPVYLVIGRRKLQDYRAAWRQSQGAITGFRLCHAAVEPATPKQATLVALERIGGLPFIGGNTVRLLVNGDETFDAICEAINRAQDTICLQFYIIRNDDLGRQVATHLIRAAERGVRVRVMYDGVGSQKLPEAWPQRLRDAGVKVLNPDQSRGPTSRLEINFRNHRKTVIVDEKTAFVGGHNIGDEYLGLDPHFGHWRDTHLELQGPIAMQAQTVFAEDWHWACGETLETSLEWKADTENIATAETTAALVPTGPGDPLDSGSLMFFAAITAATERVWIASPYFVPDTDILSALTAAALAGKDVRLLLPSIIDHYLPWVAAHAYFDEIRAAGVKVYRYQGGFMHQKVILIDNDLSAVGTANLDNRSFRLNFESMVFVADKDFASAVERMLAADLDNCEEVTRALDEQPPVIRYGAPLARLWAPIL